MKNWLLAEFGFAERAAPIVPRIVWQLGELCRHVRHVGAACARHADVEVFFHVAVGHVTSLRHKTIQSHGETPRCYTRRSAPILSYVRCAEEQHRAKARW